MKRKNRGRENIMSLFNSKMEDVEFYNWTCEHWLNTGGLITQVTAARLLGKSKGRITQMIKEGKLKEHKYKNLSFVEFPEVMKSARERIYKIMNQEIMKTIEKETRNTPISQEEIDNFKTIVKTTLEKAENVTK